jgi:hypothetical protein
MTLEKAFYPTATTIVEEALNLLGIDPEKAKVAEQEDTFLGPY